MDQKIFQSKIRSQYSMACAPLPVCSLLLAEVHASGGDPWFTGVGIVWLRLGSRFVPVGAGEGVCGEGTLASPSSFPSCWGDASVPSPHPPSLPDTFFLIEKWS